MKEINLENTNMDLIGFAKEGTSNVSIKRNKKENFGKDNRSVEKGKPRLILFYAQRCVRKFAAMQNAPRAVRREINLPYSIQWDFILGGIYADADCS